MALQVNDLYKSKKSKKFELMTTIFVGENRDSISLKGYLGKGKRMSSGDTILIVKFIKTVLS